MSIQSINDLTDSLKDLNFDSESKEDEVWKSLSVMGYPNYEISTMGRVKNISLNPQRILSGTMKPTGYIFVGLTYQNGEYRNERVHILVARLFLPTQDNTLTVDHIDRNRANNKISNLRWVNWSDQNINRNKQTYKGRSIYQFSIDGTGLAKWNTISDACRALQLTHQMIQRACAQKVQHGGYYWRYCEDIDSSVSEEWRQIPFPEYENVWASSIGRIKMKSGKITIGSPDEEGYLYVSLIDINKKRHKLRVHRLVAATFHGRNDGLVVNHKDGCKSNNLPENLEFVTVQENLTHGRKLGNRTSTPKCHVRPVIQYDFTGNEINRYPSIAEAGRQTNLAAKNIGYALVSPTRSAGGFRWKYSD